MIKLLVIVMMFLIFVAVAGCSTETIEEPPEAAVKVNDKTIQTTKGTYSWETEGLFSNSAVVADAAAPFQLAKDMEPKMVEPGSMASVEFSDGSKPQVDVYLWEGDDRGQEISLKETQLTFPTHTGKYVIEIEARWSNGEAFYTFVVEVQ